MDSITVLKKVLKQWEADFVIERHRKPNKV